MSTTTTPTKAPKARPASKGRPAPTTPGRPRGIDPIIVAQTTQEERTAILDAAAMVREAKAMTAAAKARWDMECDRDEARHPGRPPRPGEEGSPMAIAEEEICLGHKREEYWEEILRDALGNAGLDPALLQLAGLGLIPADSAWFGSTDQD